MNQNKKLPIQDKPNKKTRFITGCVTILILPLLLCGVSLFFPSLVWPLVHPFIQPSIDRNDVNNVNSSFFDSLMLGDVEIAKSLTIESQHPRLNDWFVSHKTFLCPTYWLFTNVDFLEGITGDGGGFCEEDNLCEFSRNYECYRSESLVYLFSVEDLKIQKIKDNWVVIDWKKICQKIENEAIECQ